MSAFKRHFIVVAVLVLATSCAMALPQNVVKDRAPDTNLISRDDLSGGGHHKIVVFCINVGFQGDCYNQIITNGNCVNVEKKYNDKISSFKTTENLTCVLYRDDNCQGPATNAEHMETDLREANFNDMASSFSCT